MIESDPATGTLAVGGLLTVLSGIAVWRRARTGTLMGTAGGLHLNVLLFFGIGSVLYALVLPPERRHDIPSAIVKSSLPFVLGYGIVLAVEVWKGSWVRANVREVVRRSGGLSPHLIAAFLAMSVIGYLGSLTSFSTTGVGTIFPVLKLFWYPAATAAIMIATRRNARTVLLLIAAVAVPTAFALVSGWRSELIILAGSVTLGLALRSRKWSIVSPLLVIALVLALLPFAQLKKTDYEQVQAAPVDALVGTLATPVAERIQGAAAFWAVRVNGARELAYIAEGLEAGKIQLRVGESYLDALQQLVPRILWPSKPSFNTLVNYYLAREIGLLDWTDESTSWGVNIYAEAAWNFGAVHLIWFVPAIFVLGAWLDRVVRLRIRSQGVGWFVGLAFFFFSMAIVGLVNATTFFMWGFIVGKIGDVVVRVRLFAHTAMPGSRAT